MERASLVITVLMMVLTGVGVWTYYEVTLVGRCLRWHWTGRRGSGRLSGRRTTKSLFRPVRLQHRAGIHVSSMQLRKHCNLGTRQNQKLPVLLGRHAE
jgi:hypothetical protein